MRKPLPDRVEMEFEGGLSEVATPHAGVTLLIELGRISKVMEMAHEEEFLQGRPAQGSFIPLESSRLAGFRSVLERSIHAYVAAVRPERKVTLDVDAHLVESSKDTALMTYEGFRGYQPLLVRWAEQGIVLAIQFRDGNVPAGQGH